MMLVVALLLLLPSFALAQDMPDIVRIDIDLTWHVPSFSGPVRLAGSELWQNGVGYVRANNGLYDAFRWQVTGD
jgi:hypothetical protein